MNETECIQALEGLVTREIHPLSNLANTAALLWDSLPDINWVGFYLLSGGALWLGPFQGKPACTRIDPGRGVCGTALAENRTIIVPDVHAFAGHIACDAASRSEIVAPLRLRGAAVGVLDVDSPLPDRFSARDEALLQKVAAILEACCDWTMLGYDLLDGKGMNR